MKRMLVVVVAAAAVLFGSAGAARAGGPGDVAGGPIGTGGGVIAPVAARLVIISQDGGPRLLDAHEISAQDFNVVTRPPQSDSTQKWWLTDMGGGLFTIVQASRCGGSSGPDPPEVRSPTNRLSGAAVADNLTTLCKSGCSDPST